VQRLAEYCRIYTHRETVRRYLVQRALPYPPVAGGIFYLPFCLPFALWLDQPNGLRGCTIAGFTLVLVGAGCRTLAVSSASWSVVLLHVGYALNAIAGPVAMGCVSKVAENWFPANQRATATAIAAGA
jgi:hypothetical protein